MDRVGERGACVSIYLEMYPQSFSQGQQKAGQTRQNGFVTGK